MNQILSVDLGLLKSVTASFFRKFGYEMNCADTEHESKWERNQEDTKLVKSWKILSHYFLKKKTSLLLALTLLNVTVYKVTIF